MGDLAPLRGGVPPVLDAGEDREHISMVFAGVRLELFRLSEGGHFGGASVAPGAYIATGPGGLVVMPRGIVSALEHAADLF